MKSFPDFMKKPANKIAEESLYTKGIEGYVWDGTDGSQVAIFISPERGQSAIHTHTYDEYMLVVEGRYVLIIEGKRISLRPGDEYLIPAGVPHGGEVVAGTRVFDAFGGKRVKRVGEA
ncbi:MAG TPA: cupin domain-containing protein [Dehalococcoidales bacterium]|nr:cupin domain-containing protein [Dehalococcoidales bacterium]